MMISPESYYKEYLKGKTKEEIMTAIRGLKQEIGQLKNSMEKPYDGMKTVMLQVKIPAFIGAVNIWIKPSKPMLRLVELILYQSLKKRQPILMRT
ncbi:MAG: hypothetical protein ACRCXQ_14405 [Vagococcus fluvialis]